MDSPALDFHDAVGARLLTAVLTMPTMIKERHDSLEFLNHVYLRHNVRAVVAVAPPIGVSTPDWYKRSSAPSTLLAPVLRTVHDRIVVPLAALDRHSRTTTHVTNESGELVPLYTASELNALLGGGLVSYATRALGDDLSLALADTLREIPWSAARSLEPAGVGSQQAAHSLLAKAQDDLLKLPEGVTLLRSYEFRSALAQVAGAVHLIVALNPAKGPTRILSYSHEHPLVRDRSNSQLDLSDTVGRLQRYRAVLGRFWNRAGIARLNIDLGEIGGCERYQLDADAPFDTWFAQAHIVTAGAPDLPSTPVDTSQLYRLTYSTRAPAETRSGLLSIDLRLVFTGVARTSVYASAILAAFAVLGTLRVILAPGHLFLSSNADAGASVLLLFPGVAASLLASPALHTLTATLQFPMRFTLWSMCLGSFMLAVATAISLSGLLNVVLWCVISLLMCLAAYVLYRRGKVLSSHPHA